VRRNPALPLSCQTSRPSAIATIWATCLGSAYTSWSKDPPTSHLVRAVSDSTSTGPGGAMAGSLIDRDLLVDDARRVPIYSARTASRLSAGRLFRECTDLAEAGLDGRLAWLTSLWD